MTYSSDTVTPTTLGTGTTEARLTTDSPIQVPDGISNFVSAIPYYVPTGVFTPLIIKRQGSTLMSFDCILTLT